MTAGKRIARIEFQGSTRLATKNLIPGNHVYNEKLVKRGSIEYRTWEPYRSKLAAALINGLKKIPIGDGSVVLYLGASAGTTVSHISDIVGSNGRVFAVEHASRVARDLLDRVAARRQNVTPIIQDARHPREYFGVFGRVDMVYSDVAQPDQTEIALANCRVHLRRGGFLLMVIKSRSIDVISRPDDIIERETAKLRSELRVLQMVCLEPYDKDHAMVLAKRI